MSREADLGWCAGFFDGEGHVSCKRTRPVNGKVYPLLAATITQKGDNREVLDFFQSVIGFGKVHGPYEYRTPADKLGFRYDLKYKASEVEKLFIILKPYLKSQKTLDFQMALMRSIMHDFSVTEEDLARITRLDIKKHMKEIFNG